jgi:hypothetical protein
LPELKLIITAIIEKILSKRAIKSQITLDMAANMGLAKKMFSKCYAGYRQIYSWIFIKN